MHFHQGGNQAGDHRMTETHPSKTSNLLCESHDFLLLDLYLAANRSAETHSKATRITNEKQSSSILTTSSATISFPWDAWSSDVRWLIHWQTFRSTEGFLGERKQSIAKWQHSTINSSAKRCASFFNFSAFAALKHASWLWHHQKCSLNPVGSQAFSAASFFVVEASSFFVAACSLASWATKVAVVVMFFFITLTKVSQNGSV